MEFLNKDCKKVPSFVAIDMLKKTDKSAFEKIKERKKHGKIMVAYASLGKGYAKQLAKRYDIEECFIDFSCEGEVRKYEKHGDLFGSRFWNSQVVIIEYLILVLSLSGSILSRFLT
jgi:hypothetical protein